MADALDLARLAWNGEIVVTRRNPQVNFAGVAVLPPPGAFLQASPEGEAALVSLVMEALGNENGQVLDLFAGCGTFTFPAARHCAVHAVEGDAAMAAALRDAAANAAGVKPVTASARDLFKRPLMPDELAPYSTVIFDPPEAGAQAQALQISRVQAARSKLKRVIGVSCGPASFARDARILVEGGFALQWVAPVDQFRWSARIELAALFER
jgi:23S rRNA (uracil1939-C5)-methyltransferase